MWPLEIHSRHGRIEAVLRLDLAILLFLRDSILSGRLGCISLQDAFEQGWFAHVECDWGWFRKRAFYQVGLGYADIDRIDRAEEENGGRVFTVRSPEDISWDVLIPPLRLSPAWFSHIEDLECALRRYEWWNRYTTPWIDLLRDIAKYRWGIVLFITSILIGVAFIFGVPTGVLLSDLPLVSSVIDTKILARFETARGQDGFYRALLSNIDGWSISRSEALPLSASERIFRITFKSGHTREIYVRKEADAYHVIVLHDAP